MKKLLFLYFATVSFTVSVIHISDTRIEAFREYVESKYPVHGLPFHYFNEVACSIYRVTDFIQEIRKLGDGQNPGPIWRRHLIVNDLDKLIEFFNMIGPMDRKLIGLLCNFGRAKGFLDIILVNTDASALAGILRARAGTCKSEKLAQLANTIADLTDGDIRNELYNFMNSWDRMIWSEHASFYEWSQDLEACLEILDQFSLGSDFGLIYHPRPVLYLGYHINLVRDMPDFDKVYGRTFVKYAIILLKSVLKSSEVHNVMLRTHADEHLRSIFETLGQKIPQFDMFIKEFLRDFQSIEREKKRDFNIQNIRFLFPEELYQGFLSRIESR